MVAPVGRGLTEVKWKMGSWRQVSPSTPSTGIAGAASVSWREAWSHLRERLRRMFIGIDGGGAAVAAAPPVPIREIFRRFWPYTRPFRRWIPLILVFAVLA